MPSLRDAIVRRGRPIGYMGINSAGDVAAGERVEVRIEGERLVAPVRLIVPGVVATGFVLMGLWQLDGAEVELGAVEWVPAFGGAAGEDVTAGWPVRGDPRPSRAGFRLVAINIGAAPARWLSAVMVQIHETP